MEIQLVHMLSLKQELMSTSKIRSDTLFIFLEIHFSFGLKNGWTALEKAEVKSADEEASFTTPLPTHYMVHYSVPRDYVEVIELLRGNLVEPPPTDRVRNQSPTHFITLACISQTVQVAGSVRQWLLEPEFESTLEPTTLFSHCICVA